MDRLSLIDYIDPDEGREFPEPPESYAEPIPECAEAQAILETRMTVAEYLERIRAHHATCDVCGPLEDDPECTCRAIAADLSDNRGCELHDPRTQRKEIGRETNPATRERRAG